MSTSNGILIPLDSPPKTELDCIGLATTWKKKMKWDLGHNFIPGCVDKVVKFCPPRCNFGLNGAFGVHKAPNAGPRWRYMAFQAHALHHHVVDGREIHLMQHERA